MWNVHSRAIFHFTTREGLLGILSKNFRSSFSRERITIDDGSIWDYRIPTVCFCDIPLHLISDHISEYGRYGLGLSRDWAINKKLNPVFYYQSKSLLFSEFSSLMNQQHEDIEKLREMKMTIESTRNTYLRSRYVFQYYNPNSEQNVYTTRTLQQAIDLKPTADCVR